MTGTWKTVRVYSSGYHLHLCPRPCWCSFDYTINETANSVASFCKTLVRLQLYSTDINLLAKKKTLRGDNWWPKKLIQIYSPSTNGTQYESCFMWQLEIWSHQMSVQPIPHWKSKSRQSPGSPTWKQYQKRGSVLSCFPNDSCFAKGNCQVMIIDEANAVKTIFILHGRQYKLLTQAQVLFVHDVW